MIKAEKLVKWFGPTLAVDDVSFTVERGEVLGFLGPNGAGKSTTMRMITGFLPPSSGTVHIDGHDMRAEGTVAKGQVGYLPENAPAYPEMTVHGFLHFIAEIHGLRGAEKANAVERVVDLCHLEPVRYQPIDTLSKGYRHRTCFAQSILPDPPILVLDEPTDGLDPNQKREVRDLIKRMGENKAIILSTHILEEVDAVCSRVIIIDRGKLVCNATPDELRSRAAGAGSVTVRIHDRSGAQLKQTFEEVPAVDRVLVVSEEKNAVVARLFPNRASGQAEDDRLARQVADVLRQQDIVFDELHTETGRLEEVFEQMTVDETAEEVA